MATTVRSAPVTDDPRPKRRRGLLIVLILVGLGVVAVLAAYAAVHVSRGVLSGGRPDAGPQLRELRRALPTFPAASNVVYDGMMRKCSNDSGSFQEPNLLVQLKSSRPGAAVRDEWLAALRADGWIDRGHVDDATAGFGYELTKRFSHWTGVVTFAGSSALVPVAEPYNIQGTLRGVSYCPRSD